MRVLIVNTSERTGGAAVAAHRLMDALNNHGVKATMLVCDRSGGKTRTNSLTVVSLKGHWRQQWHFLWERFVIFFHLHLRREHLFELDIANVGTDITRLRVFREADVIHLHWVNQGMLSLDGIRKILRSGKPVVMTMHDQWFFTGICHYSGTCEKYKTMCHHCELLPKPHLLGDLANQVFLKKQRAYTNTTLTFVGCSKWIADLARSSRLTENQKVVSIPNTINTDLFRPTDKIEARKAFGLPLDKSLLLFGCQRITDERKGFRYLVEALEIIKKDCLQLAQKVELVVVGGEAENVRDQMPFDIFPIRYVSDQQKMMMLYNAADVYITPSLQDNLPNTIMEAMACGVPCIGFKVGGIPEEIDHQKNGYVAAYCDAQDLARGLRWVLEEADYEALSKAAVTKVKRSYSQQSVALKYTEVYNEAIARKHYHL